MCEVDVEVTGALQWSTVDSTDVDNVVLTFVKLCQVARLFVGLVKDPYALIIVCLCHDLVGPIVVHAELGLARLSTDLRPCSAPPQGYQRCAPLFFRRGSEERPGGGFGDEGQAA